MARGAAPRRHRRPGRGARQGRVRALGRDPPAHGGLDGRRVRAPGGRRPPHAAAEAGTHRAVRHAAPVRHPARARRHTGALAEGAVDRAHR